MTVRTTFSLEEMHYFSSLPIIDRDPLRLLSYEELIPLVARGWVPFPKVEDPETRGGWNSCVRRGCDVHQHHLRGLQEALASGMELTPGGRRRLLNVLDDLIETREKLVELVDAADEGSDNWSDRMSDAWKNADVLADEITGVEKART